MSSFHVCYHCAQIPDLSQGQSIRWEAHAAGNKTSNPYWGLGDMDFYCGVQDINGALISSMQEPDRVYLIAAGEPADCLPEPGAIGLLSALALFGLLVRARRLPRRGPRRSRP